MFPSARFSLLGTRERLQGWRRAEGGTDCFLSFPLARLSPSCPCQHEPGLASAPWQLQVIPTAATECSLKFFQCLQHWPHQSSPLRDTCTKKQQLASKPRCLDLWGSSCSIRDVSINWAMPLPQRPGYQPHKAVLQASSFNNSKLLSEWWQLLSEIATYDSSIFSCGLFQLFSE